MAVVDSTELADVRADWDSICAGVFRALFVLNSIFYVFFTFDFNVYG